MMNSSVQERQLDRDRQLVLPIAPAPRFNEEDFLVAASNEHAFERLAVWPAADERVLLLLGPPGAGKSHLAAIWAQRTGAAILSPLALSASADLPALAARPVLIEDAESIADERALFHLLNLVGEHNGALLLSARRAPDLWGLAIPDLLSRLRRAESVAITAPDDALVRAVLVKLLLDRQLDVDHGVVEYVAARLGPSLDAARAFVAALDQVSLARGTRIGRNLAGEMLRRLDASE